MKTTFCGMLVLLVAASAMAQTATVTFETTAGPTVAPGDPVDWTISVAVSTGDNAGLVLFSADVVQDGANPEAIDIPTAAGVPTGMANFSRPDGITNPPETDPTTAYMGVQRGTSPGQNLIQVGGAQNTFGATLPVATGMAQNAVVTPGVGQGAQPQVIATGTITAPTTVGTYTFRLENVIANVATTINAPPAHSPAVAAAIAGLPAEITFEVASGPALCPGDSNCDGFINFRDIDYFVAAQNDNVAAWEALFGGTPPCDFLNNDANSDGFVNFRDIDPFVALQNTTCP